MSRTGTIPWVKPKFPKGLCNKRNKKSPKAIIARLARQARRAASKSAERDY